MTNSALVTPALHTTGTFPDLAIYNHGLRMDSVIAALQSRDVRSLVDLGCGDGALLKRIICSGLGLDRYVGIDTWTERVNEALSSDGSRAEWATFREGSMTELRGAIPDPEDYRRLGAVVLLETIEHVPLADVGRIEEGVFGYIAPELVVVTTPDATSRLNDEQLRARGHYFEWDVAEFHDWAGSASSNYGYSVEVKQLTGPTFIRNTQIAVFSRT